MAPPRPVYGSWHGGCIATRMERICLAGLVFATTAAIAVAAVGLRVEPFVIYNPSPSVPQGFYLRVERAPQTGDFVTIASVEVAADYAALRGFADDTDRFIKRIAAAHGQTVCAEGSSVSIDGRLVAARNSHDSEGRLLPTWSGCRTLEANEVFLLGVTADSFDGRYWGPTRLQSISGVWTRL